MLLLDDGGGVRVAGVCGEFIHGSAAEPAVNRHGPAWMRLHLDRRWLPDPTDPATLGCLLALAREAWADPTLHAVPGGSASNATRGIWWEARGARRKWYTGSFPTEADALIAAILAAPSPGVGRG